MTEKSTFMMMHDLQGFQDGSLNPEWPMHFKVVPYFTTEPGHDVKVVEAVSEMVSKTNRFYVTLGEIAMYGPEDNITVIKLELADDLKDLHLSLMQGICNAGGQFTDTTYANENYSPHITLKAGARLPSESIHRVKHLSIVQKMPKTSGKNNKLMLKQLEIPKK